MGITKWFYPYRCNFVYIYHTVTRGKRAGKYYGFPHRRKVLDKQRLQNCPDKEVFARSWRGRHPVCRHRRRRAEAACKVAKRKRQILQGLPAREVRIHRGDGEGSMRKALPAVADLQDGHTRRMLVLPQRPDLILLPPAQGAPEPLGGIGGVEPHAEPPLLRLQIRQDLAGGREGDGLVRRKAGGGEQAAEIVLKHINELKSRLL